MRIFDSHFHIIDPRYPVVANDGFVPEPFTVAAYRQRMAGCELMGGAVVSGSFQAFDQSYLRDALATLGNGFVGVTQLPVTTSDDEILSLDAAGVRALRFNLRRGGSAPLDDLEQLARRIHRIAGWHVELYVDGQALNTMEERVRLLPAVSIDHLGLSRQGIPALLRLAEQGVRVKATGFGRVDFDVKPVLRDLWAANPGCLMFGTDLPSTRAPVPYSDADLRLILDVFAGAEAERVLYGNAADFYLRRPRSAAV